MGNEVTIDSLKIQLETDASKASGGLEALEATLTKIKNATKGGVGLTAVANQLGKVNTAISGINSSSVGNLTGLAKAIDSLSKVKVSTTIAGQLGKINEILPKLNASSGADKILELVSVLKPLEELGKSSLGTTVNALKKLPEAMEKLDTKKLYGQVQSLTRIMRPLAVEMEKIAQGFSAFPSRIQKLIKENEKLSVSTDKVAKHNKNASVSFLDLGAKIMTAYMSVKKVAGIISSFVSKSNDYVENVNLFNVAMGTYAEEAGNYTDQVADIMGIDPSEWMRSQGVFMTLATGFGVASDRAYIMSKNLTQLGYDLSSFFNISTESAMQKLQSGISGELEPLRRLGYDLSQAKLEATALALGIDKSVSSMTQAEKAQLRYHAILTQVTSAQGDMARTLDTPANQLRILKAQFEQTGRAIGNIFIPALTAVLPYVNAFFQIIRAVADVIASLFGFELPTIDYSSLENVSGGADAATDSIDGTTDAVKKLQKYTMGFDELNIIDTSSGKSDALDSLGSLNFDLPEYDFLGEAQKSKVSEIVDSMKEWLGITDEIDSWSEVMDTRLGDILQTVGLIGGGLLLWKVTDSFMSAINTIKTVLSSSSHSITVGVALTLTGFAIEFSGIEDAIKTGLNRFNFGKILSGALLGTGGSALLGKGIGTFIAKAFKGSAVAGAITAGGGTISTGLIGASIGGIVAGIPMFVTGIYDAIVNGLNWLNTLLIPTGATLAGAGIGAIIGMLGGPIGAGIGALIGLAVGLVTDLILVIVQNWEQISTWFSGVLNTIGTFFTNCWNNICAVWGVVSTWFYTVIIEPVTTFFAGLWEGISSGASACWNATVEFFTPAVEWFSELFGNIFQTISDIFYNIGAVASGCWELLKIAWDEAIGFFSTLWEGISTFASDCWDGIVNVWTSATGWVDTNIIQPIATLFSGLWEDISGWATDCWDGIKTVFSTVGEFFGDTFSAAWQGIVDVFSVAGDIFVDIKDGVVSAFVTIVNAIISGINKVVKIPFDAINGFLKWLKDIDVAGYHPFKGVKLITVPQIPTIELKKDGGMVDSGQMFIAREAGPEMVGTIGRKTAVVNNEQIIEGIASGVSVANSESNALLREQNALLRGILEKESGVYLDGKHLSDSVDKYKRERGRVLVTGGAY